MSLGRKKMENIFSIWNLTSVRVYAVCVLYMTLQGTFNSIKVLLGMCGEGKTKQQHRPNYTV